MKRKEAVLAGGPFVLAVESAATDAVRAAAIATVGLIDLQREANLSPLVATDAWDKLFVTTDLLHQSMRASLAFHEAMAEVKARMGCRTIANGGGDKNPREGDFEWTPTGHAHSQAVAA